MGGNWRFYYCTCHAATQLALQVQQERTQVVCTNRDSKPGSARPEGTPAMDLGLAGIRTHVDKLKRKRTRYTSINTQHFFVLFAATQLALQLHLERTQVVCSSRQAWKRPARSHSRNGPWTWRHTHTYVDKQKRNRAKHTSRNTEHGWRTHTWKINYSVQVILFV